MTEQVNLVEKREYSAVIEDVLISLHVDHAGGGGNALSEMILHNHAWCEIFVCQRGLIILESEFGNVILVAGDAAIVPAKLSHHKLSNPPGEDVQWDSLTFDLKHRERVQGGKLFRELSGMCAGERVQVFRKAPEFCQGIIRLCTEEHRPEDVMPALKLTQLLLELARRETPAVNTLEIGTSEQHRISLLEDLISGHFMEPLNAAAVAASMHISQRQLSRIVQKRFGATFTKVLQKKRMETAARLLVSTNSSAEIIGREVGFTAKTVFYRAFHNCYGMTPAEYRKASRFENKVPESDMV